MLPGFKERKELELAQMRARQEAERKRRHPSRQKRIQREQEQWELDREKRKRDGYAFVAMGCYLRASERRMKAERYVTAMYGCKTSWPRIEAHAMYCVVAQAPARKDGDPAHYGSERAKDSRGSKSNGGSNQIGRAVPSVRVVR